MLVYQFLGHLIWGPKFKKGRKRKINVLYKYKKLGSVNLYSKLNIQPEHIKAVNRTKKLSQYNNFFMVPTILLATMVAPQVNPPLGIILLTPKLEL